jgi:hypothetical protein
VDSRVRTVIDCRMDEPGLALGRGSDSSLVTTLVLSVGPLQPLTQ